MIRIISIIKNHWITITIFILVAITFLSLLPLAELPEVPGTDKTHHFIAYGLLMFPVALRKPGKWPLFALYFVIYSGAIELVQPLVNRHGEWLDLGANVLGLICGMAFTEILIRLPVSGVKKR